MEMIFTQEIQVYAKPQFIVDYMEI